MERGRLARTGTKHTKWSPVVGNYAVIDNAICDETRDNMLAYCDASTPVDINMGGSMLRYVSAEPFAKLLKEILSGIFEEEVQSSTYYFRLNPDDFNTNLRIHQDGNIYGIKYEYAAVLYLRTDGVTGTGFWEPIDEYVGTVVPEGLEDRMQKRAFVRGVDKRMLVYKTDVFHARWPAMGFGKTQQDCRNVIVMFFNVKGNKCLF